MSMGCFFPPHTSNREDDKEKARENDLHFQKQNVVVDNLSFSLQGFKCIPIT